MLLEFVQKGRNLFFLNRFLGSCLNLASLLFYTERSHLEVAHSLEWDRPDWGEAPSRHSTPLCENQRYIPDCTTSGQLQQWSGDAHLVGEKAQWSDARHYRNDKRVSDLLKSFIFSKKREIGLKSWQSAILCSFVEWKTAV